MKKFNSKILFKTGFFLGFNSKKLFKTGFFLEFNSKKLFKTGFFLGFNSKKYSFNTKKGVPPTPTWQASTQSAGKGVVALTTPLTDWRAGLS